MNSLKNPAWSVRQIDPLRDPEWDRFVENHPHGWLTQTSHWAQVLCASFQHLTPNYLVVEDSVSRRIVAGLPLFRVESPLTGRRLVSLPFTTICDPLIDLPEHAEVLLDYLKDLIVSEQFKFVEIRTTRGNQALASSGRLFESNRFMGHEISLEQDLEEIEEKMHLMHRRSVKQGQKRLKAQGLRLKRAENENDLNRFYELYTITRKKLQLPPFPKSFFQNIWKLLRPASMVEILLAEGRQEAFAGFLITKQGNYLSVEAIGWDLRYKAFRPNHLLYWEGIKSGKDEGFKSFGFGRTEDGNSGLMLFKDRWGTRKHPMPYYYFPKSAAKSSVTVNPVLMNALKTVCTVSPAFVLPKIGKFCYRHSH